jgi:hypothetical protein
MSSEKSDAKDAVTVESRVRSLEDRLAIFQLEGAYSTTYDGGHGEQWAALFTEDGIYQGRRLDQMPEQNFVQGRKALAAFCNSNTLQCIHYLNMPDLSVEGDEARGRVNFKFRGFSVGTFGRVGVTEAEGYYDVAYKRTETGWRIRRRFTVYLDRGQRTVYGYEPSTAPFDIQNPPLQDEGKFQDRR